MWQTVVVGIAVLSAIGYLAARLWRTAQGAGGKCGGCNSCSATNSEPTNSSAPFIDVEQLTRSARKE